MFLVEWFFAGGAVGWLLSSVCYSAYPGWRGEPDAPWKSLRLGRRLNPVTHSAVAIISLIAAVLLASATDRAALFDWLLVLKAFLVGPRVHALLIGVLIGFFTEPRSGALVLAARRVGNAILGDKEKENTAWALQSAVALAIIAGVVFAIRPDSFDYVRSFKLWSFEATFADPQPSAALQRAHLNLRDYRLVVDLRQYEQFSKSYIKQDNRRGWARKLIMDDKLREKTTQIAEKLSAYVDPVIGSILCLHEKNALRYAARDRYLVAYAATWEDFLLELHAGKIKLDDEDRIKRLLERMTGLALSFKTTADEICVDPNPATAPKADGQLQEQKSNDSKNGQDPEKDAKAIAKASASAAELLRGGGYSSNEIAAITALVVVDSYLASAASDLIAFISGDSEKTDFLLKMIDGFPLSDDLVSPGIINLFYQVTDSSLNGTGPIPLENTLRMIRFATRGTDLIMSRAEGRLIELERSSPKAPTPPQICTQSDTDEGSSEANSKDVEAALEKAVGDPAKIIQVFDIFLRNAFATLTAETGVYVQSALAGQHISEAQRQGWVVAVSRLSAMLQASLRVPNIDLSSAPRTELDKLSKTRLRLTKCNKAGESSDIQYLVEPEFIFQADIALALSAILLDDGKSPSTATCTAGFYYARNAEVWLEPLRGSFALNAAQELKLKEFTSAVATEVSDKCALGQHRS